MSGDLWAAINLMGFMTTIGLFYATAKPDRPDSDAISTLLAFIIVGLCWAVFLPIGIVKQVSKMRGRNNGTN